MQENIKIAITGDFCLVHGMGELMAQRKYEEVFGDFTDGINGADLHITNLECPLTDHNIAIAKHGRSLKASPELVDAIKYAKVDIACLANNHILDFWEEGLFDTISVCEDAGIQTVGAGRNIDEAGGILYMQLKERTIAIVNIAENEFTVATETSAGANPLNIPRNFRTITEAKANADIVLVIIHGGNEFYSLPSPRIVDTYRFFADAGASVVLAHHTHFYSGYEVYNDTPIFYNLGHFIFDWFYTREDGWYIGCALMLNIGLKDEISFELKPFYQSKKGIGFKLLKGREKDDVLKDIDRLSAIIRDRSKLKKEWKRFCDEKRKDYYSNIFGLNKITKKLIRLPFIQKIIAPKSKKLELLNMIECEAHREVVVTMLKEDIRN